MQAIAGFSIYAPARRAADADALTMMLEACRRLPVMNPAPARLALASQSLPYARRVQAGMLAVALGLPIGTFCLECTKSARAATEAIRAVDAGLILAADGGTAAATLLVDASGDSRSLATLVSARGLRGEILALNPPHARLASLACKALDYERAVSAAVGAGAVGPLIALRTALNEAAPGQHVLLISYGSGSAADALLVRKEAG